MICFYLESLINKESGKPTIRYGVLWTPGGFCESERYKISYHVPKNWNISSKNLYSVERVRIPSLITIISMKKGVAVGRSNPGHNAGVQAYNQGVAVQQYKDERKLFYMKGGGGNFVAN